MLIVFIILRFLLENDILHTLTKLKIDLTKSISNGRKDVHCTAGEHIANIAGGRCLKLIL